MADTQQVLSWALERKCSLRHGDNWFLPDKTHQQLSDLRTVASAHSDKRTVDGICVTGWKIRRDKSGERHDLPSSGFRIENRLGKFGGFSEVLRICASCEANAESKLNRKVAGCFGYSDIWPDSQELDEQLWQIIEERAWEDRLRSAFPVTTPLWYGFWIESPLRRSQSELLYELLDAACDYDDPEEDDLVHLLHALEAAIEWDLPLHVSLAPLGHTDFGLYTVFPHCPRCKANAPFGRWKYEFPDDPYQCKVCGHTFNPSEHHSSECDECEYDWEATSLKSQLGISGYNKFVQQFLRHRGCSEKQAKEVIGNENKRPLLR